MAAHTKSLLEKTFPALFSAARREHGHHRFCAAAAGGLFLLALSALAMPAAGAKFIIQYGEGFADNTQRSPVGDNIGTTVGEQRRVALRYAADLLGDKIVGARDVNGDDIPIVVQASFEAMNSCNTLATSGPTQFAWFETGKEPQGALANIHYPIALANTLAAAPAQPNEADIAISFNRRIDSNCLPGKRWYYGLDDDPEKDSPHGSDEYFLATALHEILHGLGFITAANLNAGTDSACGEFFQGRPDIYSTFVKDLDTGKHWPDMTAQQRCASASNGSAIWDADHKNGDTTSAAYALLNKGLLEQHPRLHSPNPPAPGSAISHWDNSLDPRQLMQPQSGSTPIKVRNDGLGLATCVLADIGWTLNTSCPDIQLGPAPRTTIPTLTPKAASSDDSSESSSGGLGPLLLLILMATAIIRRRNR